MAAEKSHYLSGELARLSGVSSDTLRHYERLKLLAVPRRSDGNYRMYPAAALNRVLLIRRALAVGFTLPELVRILQVRDAGGAPCRQAKRLLEEKLQDLDRRIDEMTAMRGHLRGVLRDWETRLRDMPDGKPARLLETLEIPKGKTHEKKISGGRGVDRSASLRAAD